MSLLYVVLGFYLNFAKLSLNKIENKLNKVHKLTTIEKESN